MTSKNPEPPIKLRNVKKDDNETETSMNDLVSQYEPKSDEDLDSTININNYDITTPDKGDFQLKTYSNQNGSRRGDG